LSQTKFRIPRVTTAALLLGSAACASDGSSTPGGTTKGINVSNSRISAISKALCKQGQKCEEELFEEYFEDLNECIDDRADYFDQQVDSLNKACADASLDYMACYSTASCRELPEPEDEYADPIERCEELADAYDDECDGQGYDEGLSIDGSEAKRAARARAVIRKYRIPR
jgi:hypothetical protein